MGDCADWVLGADNALAVLDLAGASVNQKVIDYEHQSLHALSNGQPTPAAGWFDGLEFDVERGLYATGVTWTSKARAAIQAGEYKYISAVFRYDEKTGAVLELINAGLTNTPALDGLDAVTAARRANLSILSKMAPLVSQPLVSQPLVSQSLNGAFMDELLSKLIYCLNLPTASTVEDVLAELEKIKGLLNPANKPGDTAALSIVLADALSAQDAARAKADEVLADALVTAALTDGRLPPSLKGFAQQLPVAQLTQMLGGLTPLSIAHGLQSKISALAAGAEVTELSSDELAVCRVFGLSHEAFIAQKRTAPVGSPA